ncbi:sulfotransferase domain-containing protein [Bizionia sp.]|uniref:sulfotransferase domain-containing protein n=1 Tax=Bizionia sp. TaxID=1954480 RepID=UPI003A8DCF9E
MLLLQHLKRKLKKRWDRLNKKPIIPNKDALWIFGVQKSGTTAIAALLSKRSGLSVTLDTKMLWNPYLENIREGKLNLLQHINANPYDFSKKIIKEPAASFLIKHLKEYFYLEKYIFIYRNPYDVIRSILNRLNIEGDKVNIDINSVNPNWRYIFGDGTNYILKLSKHWLEVYSQDEYIYNDKCLFVSYDLFNEDKLKFIDELCEGLQLPKKNSILNILDEDFQPRGNTNVDLRVFFGEDNFQIINKICYHKMIELEQNFFGNNINLNS